LVLQPGAGLKNNDKMKDSRPKEFGVLCKMLNTIIGNKRFCVSSSS